MMMMMVQVGIVHWIQVAHLDVLVEVADVRQLLLANVALINDIVGSRGRWQNRDGTILSVLSILLLMSQNVLLQIRLLRIRLQAYVAAVGTNSEMDHFVLLQICSLCKRLKIKASREGKRRQLADDDKKGENAFTHLITIFALERLFT